MRPNCCQSGYACCVDDENAIGPERAVRGSWLIVASEKDEAANERFGHNSLASQQKSIISCGDESWLACDVFCDQFFVGLCLFSWFPLGYSNLLVKDLRLISNLEL